MYRNRESSRSRGRGQSRGRGHRFERSNHRATPYTRETSDKPTTVPLPTPEDRLPGFSPTERAVAKAKDDLRLAKEWQEHFNKMFEKEEFRLPYPRHCNLVPKADNLSSRLEAVLKDTVSKCKELIDDHTNHLIKEAEERISNPPVSAEQQVMNLIREQREMMNAQQEMYRSQTTHNMETILSAVSHLIKDAMKPSTAPKPDSENKTSW